MAVLRAKNAPRALRKGKQNYGASVSPPAAYAPPSDWLTYTEPLATEQKVIGTVAVWDADTNYVSFTMSITDATTYNVDWGDGTTSNNVASGTQVDHNYSYASLSAGTLTTRGYKQAIITITPTTAGKTFSSINLSSKPSVISVHSNPWLKLSISAPNATSIILSVNTANATTASMSFLEYLNIVAHNLTNMACFCQGLYSLQSVFISNTSNVTAMNQMFSGCYSLQLVPSLNTANVTTMATMFSSCYDLQSVPLFNTSKVTTMQNMFNGCYALQSVPLFNTANVTNMSSMFNLCVSLITVPLFNTISVTNMNAMFSNCSSLQEVPLFNTANVTNMSSMFSGSYALQSVPLFNTIKVTDMSNMFNACYALQSVPLFNTALVTTMAGMLQNCFNLQSIPLFNTVSVNNMTGMLSGCVSLTSVPLFNTASVTNMNGILAYCYSLQEVPLFNTANVVNMTNMFNGCYALQSVPLFNTANVTNMSSMFYSCYSLQSVPLFNTANVTNMSSMFGLCLSLQIIGDLDLRAISSASTSPTFSSYLIKASFQNTRWSLNISNNRLEAAELNALYTGLDVLNPTVTNVTSNGTTVTYTVSDITAFVANRTVTITGVDPIAYNLTNATVASVIAASNQFTVTNTATGTYVSGGIATIQDNKTITVTGNPGTTSDDPTIATNKGWTVTG